MTCVHLLLQAKFEFKDSTKIAWYAAALKLSYLPMHLDTFCQKTEVFISNFQFTCGAEFGAFG